LDDPGYVFAEHLLSQLEQLADPGQGPAMPPTLVSKLSEPGCTEIGPHMTFKLLFATATLPVTPSLRFRLQLAPGRSLLGRSLRGA
jgi:hypothetical protein